MMIDQGQSNVIVNEIQLVLDSFYYQTDKISLLNIQMYIENFENLNIGRKKSQIIALLIEKMDEKKLTSMNIYKMAQNNQNADIITIDQITSAFGKLLPLFAKDLIEFVFNQKYSKEQFIELFNQALQTQNPKNDNKTAQKQNFIKILDDALLQLKMSPALLFQQADINKNKKIDLMELKEVLMSLKAQLNNYDTIVFDDKLLREIIQDLDVNGDGQLQEQEFYNLIKQSRQNSNYQSSVANDQHLLQLNKQEIENSSKVQRLDLLPTKPNLLKIINSQTVLLETDPLSNFKSPILNDELTKAFDEIEKITSLKNALYNCEISSKLFIRLRDLSNILKREGVKLQSLVDLYQQIDTEYRSHVNIQILLQLFNEYIFSNNKPYVCNLEFKVLSKIINQFPQSLGSVQEYFAKNSNEDKLALPEKNLLPQNVDYEFQKLFKFQSKVNQHIYELVSQKFKYGLEKLQNKHLFIYLQQAYNQLYPNEQDKYKKSLNLKATIIQQDLNKNRDDQSDSKILNESQISGMQLQEEDQKQKLLRKIIITAQGQPQLPIFMKELLAKYGLPVDKTEISLMTFQQIFTTDNKFLSQEESNILFMYLHDLMAVQILDIARNKKIDKKIKSLEFCDFINKLEQQMIKNEMRVVTKKLESVQEVNLNDLIFKYIQFSSDGLILKNNLAKIFVKQYTQYIDEKTQKPLIQESEIFFLFNQIDIDQNQSLEIDELQNFIKLYTSSRKINLELYIKYFAFKLESTHKKISTPDVLKYDTLALKRISPDASKQFAAFITNHFDHAKKPELLLDLYDFIVEKIQSKNFETVIAYLYSQIDVLRNSLTQNQKFIVRSNEQLTKDIINELMKQRPNFSIYRIMDDLQFNQQEGGVIPNLGLKNHMRKLYPYIEDRKLDLFVTLVDINSDKRIEITELFKFLNEIYGKEITYEFVLNKLAVIIYSTRETAESFLAIHQINLAKIQQNLTFYQFVNAIAQIFKVSKYEGYILFEQLKIIEANQIDFKAFVDSLKGQLKRLEFQDTDKQEESDKLDGKIQKQKDKIADALKNKMIQMLKLKGQELNDSKLSEENSLKDNQQKSSARKQQKLSNFEVLKLFLDNYQDLNSVNLIQRSCLNLQMLIKQSSIIRSRLLTKRVCVVEFLYNELSREELWSEEDEKNLNDRKTKKIELKEHEKLLLTVLAMENVNKTFECNIYRFQKLIKRLNERSAIDFQMLSKMLEQRFKQIGDLLYDELISIQTIIERIKAQVDKYQKQELQFEEKTSMQQLLQILSQTYSLSFKPKEIVLLSRELKLTQDNNSIQFNILRVFLSSCGIQIKLKEVINFVFDTFEQAMIGLKTLKIYLQSHPYVDLHQTLIKSLKQGEENKIEWYLQPLKDQNESQISPVHQNGLIRDSLIQMRADQVDKQDKLQSLIKYDDTLNSKDFQSSKGLEFLIIMIKDDYVICDKTLPYRKSDDQQMQKLFSCYEKEPLIPIIEKAIAIFMGGYEQIQALQSPYLIFQMLNQFDTELYRLNDKQDQYLKSYTDLYDNYFSQNVMRHIYFKMPVSKKRVANPLVLGLEQNRIYSIIAFIHLKTEGNLQHNLIVIHNPYIKEDPRKNGELWSKGYLQNTKKNQKVIDQLQKEYDPSVYQFISDPNNCAYAYDFRDVFEHAEGSDLDLILYYNLNSQKDIKAQSLDLNYNQVIKKNELKIQQEKNSLPTAFGFLQIDLCALHKNEQLQITFKESKKVFTASKERHGIKFCKQILIFKDSIFDIELEFINKDKLDRDLSFKIYYNKDSPFKLELVEINYEIIAQQPPKISENHIQQEGNNQNKESHEKDDKSLQLSLSKSQKTEFIQMISNKDQNVALDKNNLQQKIPNAEISKIQAKGQNIKAQQKADLSQQKKLDKRDKDAVDEDAEYYDEEYDDEEEKKQNQSAVQAQVKDASQKQVSSTQIQQNTQEKGKQQSSTIQVEPVIVLSQKSQPKETTKPIDAIHKQEPGKLSTIKEETKSSHDTSSINQTSKNTLTLSNKEENKDQPNLKQQIPVQGQNNNKLEADKNLRPKNDNKLKQNDVEIKHQLEVNKLQSSAVNVQNLNHQDDDIAEDIDEEIIE